MASRTNPSGSVQSLSSSKRLCSYSSDFNMFGHSKSSSSSVRFSMERPSSPRRSISSVSQKNQVVKNQKKTCMCSPTTHPGSFRCSLHRNTSNNSSHPHHHSHNTALFPSNRLNAQRSAMTNSLVRMKRASADLIWASSTKTSQFPADTKSAFQHVQG